MIGTEGERSADSWRHLLPARHEALDVLKQVLPNKNLYDLAREFGITVHKGDKFNKGWVGQTLERAAQLPLSSRQEIDGRDFELKSTTLLLHGNVWVPKETIKVTQLNPTAIVDEEFETSAFWKKLVRLIFVGVHHESPEKCVVVKLGGADVTDPRLIEEARLFWEDVKYLVASGELDLLQNLGDSDGYFQLRPVGDGTQWSESPTTGEKFPARAFYATKNFISRLMKSAELSAF